MKFVPILKWMIAIILVVTIVAGGAAFYFLEQKEALVQREVLKRFSEAAPELDLNIGGVRLDGMRAATFTDIEIRDRETDQPLFRADELRVDIDSAQLIDRQAVVVDRIHLSTADILLTRENDGRWNWQEYDFHPPANAAGLPEIILDDVTVQLTLMHDAGIPPARLLLRDTRLQAVPGSAHSFDFDGSINLPGAGLLNLSGAWDLNSKQWSLGGHLRDIRADQELLQLAKATAPGLQSQLAQLDSVIERAVPVKTAAVDNGGNSGAALQLGNNREIAPQFQGTLDVDFAVSGKPDQTVPEFKLLVNVRDGRIATPAIPLTLTDVQAKFFRDNETLVFELQNASGIDASVKGGFEMQTGPTADPGRGWFDVKRFPVTEKLKPLLPERMLRLFNNFQPDIVVSVSGEIVHSTTGRWQPQNLAAQIHEGRAVYHRFRYPAESLNGTITQRPYAVRASTETESASTLDDIVLDVKMAGMVGPRPFESVGWWKNPGSMAETRFEMSLNDLPLDSRFRNSLAEKEQQTFDSLNLAGRASANFVFYRPPGMDQPTHTFIDAHIFDARMKFRRFPYGIENLSGHLTFNSATKKWKFLEIKGKHGDGELSAVGSFSGDRGPGELDLTVSATGASLDADLYNALTKSQRSIWNMINPDGFCDLTAQINWTAAPGQSAIVTFPERSPVRIYDTNIRPTSFPFRMKIEEAILSFDPNDVRSAGSQHCEIHSFRAMHNDSPITAEQCWAEAKPNGEWQLHLNHVSAEDLEPDDRLRAALPATWRQTLSRMSHLGRVSIHDSEMDFRGAMAGDRNTTAGWNLDLTFKDCTLNAGLDVMHVYGGVTARGAWDGFHLRNVGDINVETAEVLEMPFTNIQGPYSLNDVELVLGSRRVFEPDSTLSQVDPEGRIKALAYGGELLFDAHVDLREGGRYQFFTEVANARLEAYAALHIPEQQNLKGVITAWMSLEGTGDEAHDVTGKGQLLINPAALYEIPVIVKLLGSLSQLNLNVQDRTAFNYAFLDFVVAGEAFDFKWIDLVGESISFRGRGSAGFAGAVNLDFYSRPARSRTAALPLISGLFTNWAKVEVRGTIDRPQTMVRSAARIDEGLKLFLQPFNPNPAAPIPRLNIPRAFQRTGPLIQRRTPLDAHAGATLRE